MAWTDRAARCARVAERPAPMRAPVGKGLSADPRWRGIIEVLVRGLAGTVAWEPGSVVLHLPDQAKAARVADLDALRLCLVRLRVPVVFDASREGLPDACLLDFLRRLVESGLMEDGGRQAA